MSEYERLNALLCAIVDLTQHAALLRATQDAWATAVKQWATVATLTRREDVGAMRFTAGMPDDDSGARQRIDRSEIEF